MKNKLEVVRYHDDGYCVFLDGILQVIRYTMQDVVTWLDYNWPAGTQVSWNVKT